MILFYFVLFVLWALIHFVYGVLLCKIVQWFCNKD